MNKNYFLIAIIFITNTFLFIACSAPNIEYPEWYMQSTQDTRYLYGVGEAKSLQEAKLSALNDMASKISLSIESNLKIQKEQTNSEFLSNINNDIEISVSDIELDSVEYPFIEEIEGSFFVQARLEKVKIIHKLNNEIDLYATDIKGILNNIKDTSCNTMSPKHGMNLSNIFNKADYKSKQISSLGGDIRHKQLLENIKNILSNPPAAYYVSFAKNGTSEEYGLIDSALMTEYNKFFSIKSRNPDIYHIENIYNINKSDSKSTISLNVSIKDCNSNVVFSTSLESAKDSKDKSLADVVLRLRVQLYKKISAWMEK